MTKKSSKKTPSQLQENIVVEEEKPSAVPKKASNEIDEIFAGKKRKKADEADKRTDKVKKTKKSKKKTVRPDDDDDKFVDRPSRPRKKTEDGLSLYSEEELGLNKQDAGGTPLCPFDCSCCF
ncbi:uncharacterized protein C6G9.01c-like [Lotus japonicus]|uniref:uncharacterized protein C6G9.01c-like n=1 Tax=Lotus japonicus TaxID=34305 RepID=UPI0025899448|nr:uncharacterized protein C6G9.01c-like [Lotus japonicus]